MHLRIHTKLARPADVEKYFVNRRDEAAYYAENQEFNGFWGGKGAALLGLKEHMAKEEFSRLCHNLHPITGKQLTERMKEKRRIGYDLNWNCPKSVSLLYAYTKDERIIRAVREAIRDTMEDMEKRVATRVRVDGQNHDRITGTWVYGEFIHLTGRPEGGVPDPHLHAHCYAFNVTWDPVENKIKAAQMVDVVEAGARFQGACASRVKANLEKLGLEIVNTKDAFEIAGISRELIDEFSRRAARVNAEAERRGIVDPTQKAKLAALTRENKNKEATIPELEREWWPRLTAKTRAELEGPKAVLQQSLAAEMSEHGAAGLVTVKKAGESSRALGMLDALPETKPREAAASSDFLGTRKEVKGDSRGRRLSMNQRTRPGPRITEDVKMTEHDRRAVALAAEHLFERQSVVTEDNLIGEALKGWCVGRATVGGIEKAVAEAPLLRRRIGRRHYVTTSEILAEENRCIDTCLSGRGEYKALNPKWRIRDQKLNGGQRAGVLHVLNSRDFVTGISGKSGTGKTTLLHEAKRAIEAAGHKLLVLTPGAEAAYDECCRIRALIRSLESVGFIVINCESLNVSNY